MPSALNVSVIGLDKVLGAMRQFPKETTKEFRIAIRSHTRDVAEEAEKVHRFQTKSGNLERSISHEFDESRFQGKVFLDTGVAKYAPWIHQGTKPHIIQPKRDNAMLRFVVGGKFVFAKRVRHPGTKPDKFLYKAFARLKDLFQVKIDLAATRAIRKAGF